MKFKLNLIYKYKMYARNIILSLLLNLKRVIIVTKTLLMKDIHICISSILLSRRRCVLVWCIKTTYPISAYQWVPILLKRDVLDITLCYKVCQWLVVGWWFSPGTPVSSTNKTDRHDVAEILLKVVINTLTLLF